jgi:hypothetical protein
MDPRERDLRCRIPRLGIVKQQGLRLPFQDGRGRSRFGEGIQWGDASQHIGRPKKPAGVEGGSGQVHGDQRRQEQVKNTPDNLLDAIAAAEPCDWSNVHGFYVHNLSFYFSMRREGSFWANNLFPSSRAAGRLNPGGPTMEERNEHTPAGRKSETRNPKQIQTVGNSEMGKRRQRGSLAACEQTGL